MGWTLTFTPLISQPIAELDNVRKSTRMELNKLSLTLEDPSVIASALTAIVKHQPFPSKLSPALKTRVEALQQIIKKAEEAEGYANVVPVIMYCIQEKIDVFTKISECEQINAFHQREPLVECKTPFSQKMPQMIPNNLDRIKKIEEIRNFKGCSIKDFEKILTGYTNDMAVMLEAVDKFPQAFQMASEELRADRNVVSLAVRQSGWVLLYVSEDLRNDKSIVLKAVQKNGEALEYASKEMKANKEVVLAAWKQAEESFRYASETLKNDREFVLQAIKNGAEIYRYLSINLKNDPKIQQAHKELMH